VQRLEFECPDACRHANFRRSETGWAWFSFTGTKWQSVMTRPERYLANPYRGLLSRRMMLSSNRGCRSMSGGGAIVVFIVY
jgi:hypothetical protein